MKKNSLAVSGPRVPDAILVSKQQKLSKIVVLPLALFLPLMLLGMSRTPTLTDQNTPIDACACPSERAEVTRLIQQDLQKANDHAAYWRTVARHSGGKDTHATCRARQWSRDAAWAESRLAIRVQANASRSRE